MEGIKNVIIIGSGFSNGFAGIPVQKQFQEELTVFIEQNGYTTYRQALIDDLNYLIKHKPNLHEIGSNDYENIFSTLHYITHYSPDRSARQLALKLSLFYRNIITFFLMQKQEAFIKKPWSITGEVIKNEKIDTGNTVFISLNADEILEHSLAEHFGSYHYVLDRLTDNKNRDGFQILKLYGSISWFEEHVYNPVNGNFEPGKKEKKGPAFTKLNNIALHPLHTGYCTTVSNHNMDVAYTPVIVPFFTQKTEHHTATWNTVFSAIYKRCAEVLYQCEKIRIIGYGLPKADWPMAGLLTSASCRDKDIKVILPNNKFDPVILQYQAIFQSKTIHLKRGAEKYFELEK